VELGQVFSENFGLFPLPIYIASPSPQSSSLSPEAGTIGQEWPECQKPHKPNKKKLMKFYELIAVSPLLATSECRPLEQKHNGMADMRYQATGIRIMLGTNGLEESKLVYC
jgi:hypothetical protein